MSDDLYVYPGTSVLRNALDIRDGERLQHVEANLTRLRLARLAEAPPPGRYDLAHLQGIHRMTPATSSAGTRLTPRATSKPRSPRCGVMNSRCAIS